MPSRHRMLLTIAACALATACAGSSSATTAPGTATYTLQMHQDSAAVYGCKGTSAQCMACSFYCMYYVASTSQFGAKLILKAGDTTATFQSLPGIAKTSGTTTLISVQVSIYCDRYTLQATINGTSISGTWSEQLDCHGLNRIGTFSGTS